MTPSAITVLVDDVVVPKGDYRVSATPTTRLVVVRRWFIPASIFMAIFAAFWDAGIVIASIVGRPPIPHILVAVVLTYICAAMIVNRTRITLDGGILTIRNGPIPFPGNRRIEASTIERFHCTVVPGRKGQSYSLVATLSGRTVSLLTGLPDIEQARFLEDLLQQRLGTERKPEL